ncbi:hypothetical protein NDA10_007452 [Ustilago hordei]|nr:hypothetical protein NDA10_007452 [Ustilago hordei]
MPPKIANATQVDIQEGTPAETTSDRPVSKPESPIKAGSPSNVLDWAAKVEIAEAKKAHNEAWKTECKDKVAQKKQAKLAQLDADRLAGKPPLRGCVQCKTHHWEQDPCPPKPMASPEKEASKIKSSGVGKRKHTGAEIENSGGPSKKGGPIVENPPDLPVVAAAFYEVLFAEQPTNARKGREFIDLMPKIPRALGESISAPITSTEVRAAIKGAPTVYSGKSILAPWHSYGNRYHGPGPNSLGRRPYEL